MSLYELPNATDGLDSILIGIVAEVPSLMIMISFTVFSFVFIVGMGMQQRKTGTSDVPMWSTLASVSVVFLNLIMSLGTGIVNPIVLGVSVALTTFSAFWLFWDNNK